MLLNNEKLQTIRRFTASVAHDMHHSLAGIQLCIQRLEQNRGGVSGDIRLLKEELRRLELVTNTLELLGNPNGGLKQAHDILEITNDVITRLSGNIPLKFVNLMRAEAVIYCNAAQIKQVMVEMLKNASDATRAGDAVKIGLRHNQQDVFIDIVDHGCGIPPDVVEQLGQPFFTTKERGKGLGLYLAFQIVKDHQGEIHIDSRPDVGTTVTIKLPIFR